MKPLVSIICLSYNHENYISQALDGFFMQKVNFEYEVIVHDDASLDKTQEIIRTYKKKYPEVLKPILQSENQYSKGGGIVTKIAYRAASGKYIAFCEGDDYWTDPYKLQKQVDFLEENLDYGMVHTNYSVLYNSKNQIQVKKRLNIQEGSIFLNLLLSGNHIATLTVLVRTDILKKSSDIIYEPSLENKWSMGDYPLWLCIAQQSKVGYINTLTSVYRELENSASHSPNGSKEFMILESICNIGRWFCDKYNFNDYLPIINENELFIGYHLSLLFNSEDKNLYRKKVRKHKIIQKNFRNIVLYIASVSLLFQRLLSYLKV